MITAECFQFLFKAFSEVTKFHVPPLQDWLIFLPCSQMYKHSNNKTMTSGAIAAMLSTILYGRRFFPYYVYNIIGGLDEEGKYFQYGTVSLFYA